MDLHRIRNWRFEPVIQNYEERDTILYALGIGYGADPLDELDLPFVFEHKLQAAPSMAVVLGYPGSWMREPEAGIDWVRMLHGEQAITLHRPLAPRGTVRAEHRILGVEDKGAEKGALMVIERQLFDDESDAPLATLWQNMFLRGDGGCGSFGEVPKFSTELPDGPPVDEVTVPTAANQALIYRLSGDLNPVHVDPAVARQAGFPRPILHGLASFGIAARAIIRAYAQGDPTKLKSLSVRLSRPAFPGDTIRFELYPDERKIRFRAIAVERNETILNGCEAVLTD
ncbi:MaoC/PaaZ C-terminal domain-containing protein [Novosphingobium pentaromativorans]|uniref:3-alpha,7-alpha, 12-alpha-trihydroxy-5-beta-cholest-24-enoyl-CoAhydratase n=1 Tax=Novosphingobium pentaromativorans US6-1 TaxID=1088721 RepID=G6EGQ1_9SPHN|nr:MaoC/PaaZ C-terminal domain-containing protein [Novosphingobium pentaromativorans]AIT82096.1 hypothetical protein JI59_21410 [Novosphingobium pentaromativorans US6-1]EHJ59494.1 3-alpha,7-alpha,12-alpha-trihydroxy-5-beta-cholest-24-enoyl-CoAhydratase [Novosphingobium pentaromativorans US6-1]